MHTRRTIGIVDTGIPDPGTWIRRMPLRNRGARALALAVLALTLAWGEAPRAAEVIVQNDSGSGSPLVTFITGERVAAWLTAPVSGDLVAVQVDWGSVVGGAPTSMETSITIHAGGTFPTPGAALAVVTTPTLVDGIVNEFRHLDPGMTIPLQVAVTAGQTFVVALEFFNTQTSGSLFEPSVLVDGSCQSSRNAAYPLPAATWTDACLLGVPGDFLIRAVIDEQTASVPTLLPAGIALLAGFLLMLMGSGRRLRRGRR